MTTDRGNVSGIRQRIQRGRNFPKQDRQYPRRAGSGSPRYDTADVAQNGTARRRRQSRRGGGGGDGRPGSFVDPRRRRAIQTALGRTRPLSETLPYKPAAKPLICKPATAAPHAGCHRQRQAAESTGRLTRRLTAGGSPALHCSDTAPCSCGRISPDRAPPGYPCPSGPHD